jgi:hypothetical protein
VAILLPVSLAYASSDDTCEASATIRQNDYSCGGLPILSPGNDTRINAMLLMARPETFAQFLPAPANVMSPDRISELPIPFVYDFSGWIDYSRSLSGTSNDNATDGVQADRYADGEGSICRSIASGDKAFYESLGAAKQLPADEVMRLRAARADIGKACTNSGARVTWTKPVGLKSPLGQQFATYLDGAFAFYQGDFFHATNAFASASHSSDPWLKESALYMTGRAQLNAAQANVFESDSNALNRSAVVKVSLGAADTVFRAYLHVYPHGQYSTSAAGLQRRVAWLGGDVGRQSELYATAFANWSPATSNVRLDQLANELDSKFLMADIDPGRIQSPQLLATLDLMRMRVPYSKDANSPKPIALNELQAQKPRFGAAPALHSFLLAAWYVYVGHQPDQALALLPQASDAPLDYFGLSQQTLRAFALEDSGKAEDARQLWASLIPLATFRFQREALELALAINLEQAGLVDRVFADDSLVQNTAIRATLLQRAAGASLLRAQAQNSATNGALRDLALYTLLYKELTRGHYPDFIGNLALIRDNAAKPLQAFAAAGTVDDIGYACPSMRDVATILQRDPQDPKALNCLGEFVRRNPPAYSLVEDPIVFQTVQQPVTSYPATLGSSPSQFPGKTFERMANYQQVMNNAQASADDRAYALYRAIRCFAPAGSSDCGGDNIPRETRKRWFNTLKSTYPRSLAAQSLRYYW